MKMEDEPPVMETVKHLLKEVFGLCGDDYRKYESIAQRKCFQGAVHQDIPSIISVGDCPFYKEDSGVVCWIPGHIRMLGPSFRCYLDHLVEEKDFDTDYWNGPWRGLRKAYFDTFLSTSWEWKELSKHFQHFYLNQSAASWGVPVSELDPKYARILELRYKPKAEEPVAGLTRTVHPIMKKSADQALADKTVSVDPKDDVCSQGFDFTEGASVVLDEQIKFVKSLSMKTRNLIPVEESLGKKTRNLMTDYDSSNVDDGNMRPKDYFESGSELPFKNKPPDTKQSAGLDNWQSFKDSKALSLRIDAIETTDLSCLPTNFPEASEVIYGYETTLQGLPNIKPCLVDSAVPKNRLTRSIKSVSFQCNNSPTPITPETNQGFSDVQHDCKGVVLCIDDDSESLTVLGNDDSDSIDCFGPKTPSLSSVDISSAMISQDPMFLGDVLGQDGLSHGPECFSYTGCDLFQDAWQICDMAPLFTDGDDVHTECITFHQVSEPENSFPLTNSPCIQHGELTVDRVGTVSIEESNSGGSFGVSQCGQICDVDETELASKTPSLSSVSDGRIRLDTLESTSGDDIKSSSQPIAHDCKSPMIAFQNCPVDVLSSNLLTTGVPTTTKVSDDLASDYEASFVSDEYSFFEQRNSGDICGLSSHAQHLGLTYELEKGSSCFVHRDNSEFLKIEDYGQQFTTYKPLLLFEDRIQMCCVFHLTRNDVQDRLCEFPVAADKRTLTLFDISTHELHSDDCIGPHGSFEHDTCLALDFPSLALPLCERNGFGSPWQSLCTRLTFNAIVNFPDCGCCSSNRPIVSQSTLFSSQNVLISLSVRCLDRSVPIVPFMEDGEEGWLYESTSPNSMFVNSSSQVWKSVNCSITNAIYCLYGELFTSFAKYGEFSETKENSGSYIHFSVARDAFEIAVCMVPCDPILSLIDQSMLNSCIDRAYLLVLFDTKTRILIFDNRDTPEYGYVDSPLMMAQIPRKQWHVLSATNAGHVGERAGNLLLPSQYCPTEFGALLWLVESSDTVISCEQQRIILCHMDQTSDNDLSNAIGWGVTSISSNLMASSLRLWMN